MRFCSGRPGTTAGLVNAPRLCAAPDPTYFLAVLGVFSTEQHLEFRQEIRQSWFKAHTPAIKPRFVLRGVGIRRSTLDEADAHPDIIFVGGSANDTCFTEPLRKLMLWLECAAVAWPSATMVGKADDDAWAHLPAVATHLKESRVLLRRHFPPEMKPAFLWGQERLPKLLITPTLSHP